MSCCVIFLFRFKSAKRWLSSFCLVWFWAGQVFCFGSGFVSVWKNNLFEKEHEKKRVERFCFGLLSLLGLELTRAKLLPAFWFFLFELKEKREGTNIFFFNWVALASSCVLKIDFLFMLEHSTSFNNRLVSDSFFSFSFRLRLVLFRICTKRNEKRNSIFLFHGERKKMVRICFIEIKLSSRMVSLSQLTCQNWWRGDN